MENKQAKCFAPLVSSSHKLRNTRLLALTQHTKLDIIIHYLNEDQNERFSLTEQSCTNRQVHSSVKQYKIITCYYMQVRMIQHFTNIAACKNIQLYINNQKKYIGLHLYYIINEKCLVTSLITCLCPYHRNEVYSVNVFHLM